MKLFNALALSPPTASAVVDAKSLRGVEVETSVVVTQNKSSIVNKTRDTMSS
jgi:hypothetical protein